MTVSGDVAAFSYVTLLVTGGYSAVLAVYVAAMLGFAFWESRFRRRQSDAEDYDVLLVSRYTIPVSIIAPAFNEEVMVVPAVRSLLNLSYPELEVIVVDDGSTDGTLAALIAEFGLEPRQAFFRNHLATNPVRAVYRSAREPRLIVVAKENGGKADAVNCGVNFARFRYLCCVDGDTVFEPDALVAAMALIAKDPARIVGAASLFGISLEPEANHAPTRHASRTNGHLLADFQHLDLMRSFVAYRSAWSRLDCMLCVSGAFGIWRRDVILEMGGFSREFTCEDIEMTFRIHERFLREKRPYRILSLPQMVAQTEGPNGVRSLISQRARWQRVTLETIWHYRRMLGRKQYRSAGLVGLPYYVLFECLAPVFQLVSLIALAIAIAFGLLGWHAYLAFIGIMMFGTAIPTTVAVWLHDVGFRDYRVSDLVRMIALGPLDLLFYRPILIYAGLRGCWEFLRKQKGWNKFERNTRKTATAAALSVPLMLGAVRHARAQSGNPVAEARQLAQAGQNRAATEMVERRIATNPGDLDAHVLHGTLLSWRGDLSGARRELEAVLAQNSANTDAKIALVYVELWSGHAARAERLSEEAGAASPENVDVLVARATVLRQLNRRAEALISIERAATLAPARPDVARLDALLRQDVHGSEVMLSQEYESWGDHRDPWRETQIAVRQGSPLGDGIVRVARATRFGLQDTKVEVEAYPAVGPGYAALGVGYASNPQLYARSTLAAEWFGSFPGKVEGSVGYRRLNFASAVNLFTASAGVYDHDFLYTARLNNASGGAAGTSLFLSARRYLGDEVQYVEVQAGAGSLRSDLRTDADLVATSNRMLGADALFLVRSRWLVTVRGAIERDHAPGGDVVAHALIGVGLGVRF